MHADEYRSLFYPFLSAFIWGRSRLTFVHLCRPGYDVPGWEQILQMAQNTPHLIRRVEELDHHRQIERQVEQRRGMHHAGTAETADPAKHRDAAHLLFVVQLCQ